MERIVAALKPLFDAVNSRFDAIDSRFDAIDSRLDGADARFGRMAAQVSKLVGDVAEIKGAMATREQMSALSSSLHKRIDDFLPVIETARGQKANSDKSFWAHQGRLDDHERRISRLENKPE